MPLMAALVCAFGVSTYRRYLAPGSRGACALAPERITDKTRQKVSLFPSMFSGHRWAANQPLLFLDGHRVGPNRRRHSFPSTLKGVAPQWQRVKRVKRRVDPSAFPQ